jgi:hypothetical protein
MEVVTFKLFPTLVHKIKTRGWEKYKGYLLDTIRDTKDPEYRPTEGFYTDYGRHQVWREKIWNEFLEPQISPLLEQTNTRLQDIWAQQYINLADHSAHQHQPVGYSCVFYAQFDPEHHWSTMLFRPFLDPNDEMNSNAVYSPKMEEGEILVFPSWMLHQAPPSKSLVPRTVIAFNLEPKYLNIK